MRVHFIDKLRAVLSGSWWEAKRQLRCMNTSAHSPWLRQPRPGHLRGIDYYTPEQLTWVVAKALRRFKTKFGHYPNLVQPVSFNDKVMWFKFFGELKAPESGNKLATPTLVPQELKAHLPCLPLVWQGEIATLPANDALAPGLYYLKSSHGSGMFERLTYPLSPGRRIELEAKARKWLKRRPGWDNGEWWYNVFEPRLMIERSITGDKNSISWNFYVLNGQVPMVGLFLKTREGQSYSTWLDAEFRELPWRSVLPAVPGYVIGPKQHEMMRLAREVARPFPAVRVDFLLGEDGSIYLCELTFSPGNAMSRRPPEVEALLSAPWKDLR